ncbi:MAG: AbiH family protein [Bacteroidales bacterium]|nr:AbiH family protein [Bacteroidales bacterium]
MKTIFVIGNGFDLAHGLKTSYSDFLESYYVIPSKNKLLTLLKNNSLNLWSDIEYTYFRFLNFYDNIRGIKGFRYENSFDSSKELDDNFEMLKQLLENYLFKEQEELKLITEYSKLFSTFNDENTMILDFNYTNTVYKYLNGIGSLAKHIKIHGELSSDDNPIIFGYAANDEEVKVLSDKNDEYLMKNIKRLRYLLSDNEIKLKKILDFTRYDVDVYILGHSCGVSDRLILNELFTHPSVKGITLLNYREKEGYLKTTINIYRILEDYNKPDKKDRSLSKIFNFKESTEILQKMSTQTDKKEFLKFIALMKEKHDKKKLTRLINLAIS